MTPSFESHSQSSSSTSTSWDSNTSSDSCSMYGYTPKKIKSASACGIHISTDAMKNILKSDLDNHILDNVSVSHFVEHVWGLEPAKASKILNEKFQLPDDLLTSYLSIINTNKQHEPELHKPFRGMARALLKSVCDHFSIPHTVLQTYFWDGEGKTFVSHHPRLMSSLSNAQEMFVEMNKDSKYGMLKPDLLELYIPMDEDNNPLLNPDNEDSIKNADTPTWALARAPVEFKKGRKTVTIKLDPLPEGEATGNKRPGSPSLTKEHGDAKKQRTMASPNIPLDELQLANYALQCLYAGNRHYATGIFINGVTFRLWYYDRSGAMRTVLHDFTRPSGTANLAAALFALSQSNMKQAGFDPYLYRLTGKHDGPIQSSTVIPLTKPLSMMKDVCYKFTKGANEEHVFPIHGFISRYRGINGRGTVAAEVCHGVIGKPFSPNLYVLKMSWQFPICKHEGEIISHLREALPDWHDHLPDPIFYTKITAEELAMPKYNIYNAMKDSATPPSDHSDDRDLHVIAMNRYKHLWEANDIEEFKQVFIDCVECHYHSFESGHVLHGDVSDDNLMIYLKDENVADNGENASGTSVKIEPRACGVLNDFDMAVILGPDGKPTTSSTDDHHITGTLPFMARHLLKTLEERERDQAMYPGIPTYHLYRYDLESFFYVLIWAATCYDLKSGRRLDLPSESPLVDWSDPIHLKRAAQSKELGFHLMDNLESDIRSEWKGLWREWIEPLFILFHDGLRCSEVAQRQGDVADFTTGGGHLTFENFMATIKVKPRKFDPKN